MYQKLRHWYVGVAEGGGCLRSFVPRVRQATPEQALLFFLLWRWCGSYLRADAQPLEKGRPVEIKFKLSPTSFRFLKGQVRHWGVLCCLSVSVFDGGQLSFFSRQKRCIIETATAGASFLTKRARTQLVCQTRPMTL